MNAQSYTLTSFLHFNVKIKDPKGIKDMVKEKALHDCNEFLPTGYMMLTFEWIQVQLKYYYPW